MDRKLVAVLAADVAGYSRLTALDEEGSTVQLQQVMRAVKSRIAEAGGTPFTEAGDGLLAQFASPLEAIRCGLETQRDLNLLNCDLPADRRMFMRMGVTVADALVVGSDLYGDNINAAVRIEAAAEPGQIFVSETAFDLVKSTNIFRFERPRAWTLSFLSSRAPWKRRHFTFLVDTRRRLIPIIDYTNPIG